jgi:Domain of Unknown Function (DUF1080)
MKNAALLSLAALFLSTLISGAAPVPLSDGKTFNGWEFGDTALWRIEEGAFVGGTLKETVPHIDYLATEKSYKNFELRLKFKLIGTEGFINGGVQIRSKRIPNFEMEGYQADMGDKYWGVLWEESRRDKVLAPANMDEVNKVLKHDDWNDYRILCEGRRVRLWINGLQTVDYTEPDPAILQEGKIGLQIHSGGKAEAWYKDIVIEELPETLVPAKP